MNNKSIVSLLPRGRHHLSQPALVPLTRAGKGDWGVVHLWEGVGKGEGGIGSRHKEEGGRGAAAEAKPPAPPLSSCIDHTLWWTRTDRAMMIA